MSRPQNNCILETSLSDIGRREESRLSFTVSGLLLCFSFYFIVTELTFVSEVGGEVVLSFLFATDK